MAVSILWRACLAQAIVVGSLFALLVALPLPRALFRDFGTFVGPLSWLLCSLIVARVLSLRVGAALTGAVVSGLVAVAVNAVAGHAAGMVVGVLAFGVVCALAVSLGVRPDAARPGAGGSRSQGRLSRPRPRSCRRTGRRAPDSGSKGGRRSAGGPLPPSAGGAAPRHQAAQRVHVEATRRLEPVRIGQDGDGVVRAPEALENQVGVVEVLLARVVVHHDHAG